MENLKTLDDEALTSRKDELFEALVKIVYDLYSLYGEEVNAIYSKNARHPRTFLTEEDFHKNYSSIRKKVFIKSTEEFLKFMQIHSYAENLEHEQMDDCLKAFNELVDTHAVLQYSLIMEVFKACPVPLDPSKLLMKAIRRFMEELYKAQKFYPKRKGLVYAPEVKRSEDYLSDFEDYN